MNCFCVYAVPRNDPDPTVCDPSTLAVTEPDKNLVYKLRSREILRSSTPVVRATRRTRSSTPVVRATKRTRSSSSLAATEPVVLLPRTVFPPRPSSSSAATGPPFLRLVRIDCPPRPSSSFATEPDVNDLDDRTVCPPRPSSSLVATERDAAGPSTVSKEPIQQHFCWNCGRHGCQKKECPYPTNYRKTGIVWPPPPEVPPPPSGASNREIGDWVFKYKKSHPATVPYHEAKRNLL